METIPRKPIPQSMEHDFPAKVWDSAKGPFLDRRVLPIVYTSDAELSPHWCPERDSNPHFLTEIGF